MVLGVFLAVVIATSPARAQPVQLSPVTDAMLRRPPDQDWLHWRRTYDGWAYSPLDQITRENVATLQLAWSRTLGEGPIELVPLVHDGVMFLPEPDGRVTALDATSGDLIWQYQRDSPGIMRSLAIYEDKVYYASPRDGYLVALDARTGVVVWETSAHDPDCCRHSSGPIVVAGKVLSGRACNNNLAGGCFIAAHDARTGRELWRRYTVARPGEPGGDSWDIPLELRRHVSPWMPGTYDPDLNLVYWGTGVPGPYPHISLGSREGDLLYSNSTLALNPDTGEVVWHFQHLPGDELDMDHAHERILVDAPFRPSDELEWFNPSMATGQPRRLLWAAGKAGTQFVLDRATGQFVWARPLVHQNIIASVDEQGRVTKNAALGHRRIGDVVVAGARGGKDWWYGAYSPLTNAIYQPLLNAWLEQTSSEWDGGASQGAARRTIPSPSEPEYPGMVKAFDVSTGDLLWEQKRHAPWLGGLVTTGGGLVFGGDINRRFQALDQETGAVLWETILNSRVTGGAISYGVNGRQYIAVATGGGSSSSYETFGLAPGIRLEAPEGGNAIFVFALPRRTP